MTLMMLPSTPSSPSPPSTTSTIRSPAVEKQRRQTITTMGSVRTTSPRRKAHTEMASYHHGRGLRSKSEITMQTFASLEKLPSPASDVAGRPVSRETRSSGTPPWNDDRPETWARLFRPKTSRWWSMGRGSKSEWVSRRTAGMAAPY